MVEWQAGAAVVATVTEAGAMRPAAAMADPAIELGAPALAVA